MILLQSPDSSGRPPPPDDGVEPHELFSAHRASLRVLVVDDDSAKRYALSRSLRAAGFQVMEAAHGSGALALIGDCSAAVLDVYLPDIDGFELCRRLRQQRPAMPIVQVSSVLVEEPYRDKGRDAGADAYLAGPEMEELVRTLDALLQRGKSIQ